MIEITALRPHARVLYDKLARFNGFIRYDFSLG